MHKIHNEDVFIASFADQEISSLNFDLSSVSIFLSSLDFVPISSGVSTKKIYEAGRAIIHTDIPIQNQAILQLLLSEPINNCAKRGNKPIPME